MPHDHDDVDTNNNGESLEHEDRCVRIARAITLRFDVAQPAALSSQDLVKADDRRARQSFRHTDEHRTV